LAHGNEFKDKQEQGDEEKFKETSERVMAQVRQMVQIGSDKRKGRDVFPDVADGHVEIGMRVKIAVGVENPVEEFAAVDKDPVEVGQGGENDAPFKFLPPKDEENDGGDDDEQVVANPHGTFEVRLGGVIGEVGQFVEKPMREKGEPGGEAEGEFPVPHALKGFLDDDTSEDVGGFLHGRDF
jgi:hypothetical protein